MLNVLHLEHTDVDVITAKLQKSRDEMPQFFMQSPIIIDCAALGDESKNFDFYKFKVALLKLSFIPVGIRNCPPTMNSALRKSGWAIMRESRKANNEEVKKVDEAVHDDDDIYNMELPLGGPESLAKEPAVPEKPQVQTDSSFLPGAETKVAKSLTVDKPVRSGQQIYAADSDMTILSSTSAGSEIMADGSIHVYGALRGRVLAGALGNESARIFCQSLEAELIAIAGRYQLLDESDTNLIGKAAMIKLVGEKLVIEPLVGTS